MPDGLLISLPWTNLTTQAMYQSGRSPFENGCGSYPSWLNCVSYLGVCFSKILVVLMISTAFAVAFGIFRENNIGLGPVLPIWPLCAISLIKSGTYTHCNPSSAP